MAVRLVLATVVSLMLSGCVHRELTAPCGPLGAAVSGWFFGELLAGDPCGPLRPVNTRGQD
jgi:hypothetical protein